MKKKNIVICMDEKTAAIRGLIICAIYSFICSFGPAAMIREFKSEIDIMDLVWLIWPILFIAFGMFFVLLIIIISCEKKK